MGISNKEVVIFQRNPFNESYLNILIQTLHSLYIYILVLFLNMQNNTNSFTKSYLLKWKFSFCEMKIIWILYINIKEKIKVETEREYFSLGNTESTETSCNWFKVYLLNLDEAIV